MATARILVVDDNEALLSTASLVLSQAGYHVMQATDGAKALRLAAVESFDLIITDIIMPDREGIETIRELRLKFPSIKIIAMSGGGRGSATGYLAIARFQGAALTLSKPFSRQELLDAVTSVLGADPAPQPPVAI
jgi:hypothetical protein